MNTVKLENREYTIAAGCLPLVQQYATFGVAVMVGFLEKEDDFHRGNAAGRLILEAQGAITLVVTREGERVTIAIKE